MNIVVIELVWVIGQGFESVMGQGFVKEKNFVEIQWDCEV